MGDYQISKITKVILMCENEEGENCTVTYDVEGDSATASLSLSGTSTPELTITGKVDTMTMRVFENEDIDISSESLDNFLEQFVKG